MRNINSILFKVVGGFAAEYFVPSPLPSGDGGVVNGSSSSVTSDQQQQGVTREPSFYDKPLPPEPPESEPYAHEVQSHKVTPARHQSVICEFQNCVALLFMNNPAGRRGHGEAIGRTRRRDGITEGQ